tara:strand:+ start:5312 stop:5494 length:183 start_codon:yes stop_codon:yes gene_type:complete
MKVGDIVILKQDSINDMYGGVGLITDIVEDDSGFPHYEVMTGNNRGWYYNHELEDINESR